MRSLLANFLQRVGRWLEPKSQRFDTNSAFLDAFHRKREPRGRDLLAELKNTAWTCASINSAVCASHPPRLFVRTTPGQKSPVFATRQLSAQHPLALEHKGRFRVEEVVEHPLLSLLEGVNPVHNSHDLWELTTLFQEVHGTAYWLIEFDEVLGIPSQIWILPSHRVQPIRLAGSKKLVDFYEYHNGTTTERIDAERVIAFRYPDPRDPYLSGLSPLRACFESVALNSLFLAYKRTIWDNAALPGVILSPSENISHVERQRLERVWNQRFRHGGNGQVLVSDAKLNVDVLNTSFADVAALAEAGATQADIANAFGIPQAFLTSETNLANLQAAEHQHASKAIRPRLLRRDQKLNEQLLPMFDPEGRLFLASDDPIPANVEERRRQQELDLEYGVCTINEVRAERGLPPVDWGNKPWLPVQWMPTDFPDRDLFTPESGRAKEPRN